MKNLHTSDWYAGRVLHGVDMHAQKAAFFDHQVEQVAERQVDAVLISGEVQDQAIPAVQLEALATRAWIFGDGDYTYDSAEGRDSGLEKE